jgi:hypothetical protein
MRAFLADSVDAPHCRPPAGFRRRDRSAPTGRDTTGTPCAVTQLATSILDANLEALSAASPDAVARIREASATSDIQFVTTDDGELSAQVGDGADARWLASRRRPREEARRLVEPINLKEAALLVVAGFGLGYHVQELSKRLGRSGVILVFEPDVALLRAVLERIDCSEWIRSGNIAILTDPDDGAAMSDCLRGLEGLVGLGVTLVQHPSSLQRLGPAARRFQERLVGIVDAVKMTVITTLCQGRVTMRNLFQNADVYAASRGIADLTDAAKGRAAIVVSAGPSLKRNVELLKDPAVRERCVIVAVQTVLKPLLAMGIRPHFVTALDYSEINRRFYEGLTAADVEGITLIVEPKVNPSVLVAWPGAVRCIGDGTLDLLLGKELSGRAESERLKQGATVAHLAYYFARHLGCDPVALIGQDLGFTDGQYYAAGASIHNIWAGELNEFKSLELLEWQRIARMGPHLRPATDALGRPMYTDSQMHSYLVQFEADFREHAAKGLTTIDATEGGVRKQHTQPLPLRAFLDRFAAASGPSIDTLLAGRAPGSARPDRALVQKLTTRIGAVRQQARRVADISKKTSVMLAEMQEHHADRMRVDKLIDRVHALGGEVEGITPGFGLTQLLGQKAVFNRVRADRMILLGSEASEVERQKLQIQRDIENVRGLGEAATELGQMLDASLATIAGGERITRDLPQSEIELEINPAAASRSRAAVVSAIIPIDLTRGGLGTPRRLDVPIAGRRSVLAMTVDRLLACSELRDIILATDDVAETRVLLEPRQLESGRVRIEIDSTRPDPRRKRGIEIGRTWASTCWRGGLGDLTIFDEVFNPAQCVRLLDRIDADAALVVGPDWAAVDPELCARIIRRHREDPRINRLTFTQAVPGLCGCVVSRSLAHDLSKDAGSDRLAFATVGGVLGYMPGAPLQDLIAHPICVTVPTPARDCGLRLVADSAWSCKVLSDALGSSATADSEQIVTQALAHRDAAPVTEWVIDLASSAPVSPESVINRIGAGRAAVTLLAPPGEASRAIELTRSLTESGAAVHIRVPATDLSPHLGDQLVRSGAAIISADFSEHPENAHAISAVEALIQARRSFIGGDNGLGSPWVVARMTRTDATWSAVEEFVNRWVLACGWAAIDPLPAARPGERVGPLPLPTSAAARLGRIGRMP